MSSWPPSCVHYRALRIGRRGSRTVGSGAPDQGYRCWWRPVFRPRPGTTGRRDLAPERPSKLVMRVRSPSPALSRVSRSSWSAVISVVALSDRCRPLQPLRTRPIAPRSRPGRWRTGSAPLGSPRRASVDHRQGPPGPMWSTLRVVNGLPSTPAMCRLVPRRLAALRQHRTGGQPWRGRHDGEPPPSPRRLVATHEPSTTPRLRASSSLAVPSCVGGHEILPIGGHEPPRWWTRLLPTGGQQISPAPTCWAPGIHHRGAPPG